MNARASLLFDMMIDSWKAFDNSVKLSEEALAADKFKNYANLKQLVHKCFFKFDRDFRNYKADIIKKAVNCEEKFNSKIGMTVPNHQYNDTWAFIEMNRYSDTLEYLDNGLEAILPELEFNQDCLEFLITVANSEFSVIKKAIKNLQTEIRELPDSSVTSHDKAVLDELLDTLTYRIITDLRDKVNDVLNYGENQSQEKELILEKYERQDWVAFMSQPY